MRAVGGSNQRRSLETEDVISDTAKMFENLCSDNFSLVMVTKSQALISALLRRRDANGAYASRKVPQYYICECSTSNMESHKIIT